MTFFGTELHEAVTDTPDAYAWHLRRASDGSVEERRLPTRLLAESPMLPPSTAASHG